MQLALVVNHIKQKMPDLRQVNVAATVQTAIDGFGLKAWPAACVFMPRGNAGKNTLTNAVNQSVDDTFGVLLVVRNVGDAHGQAAYAEMDALRPRLIATLLGWSFDEAYAPIEYVGYQLIAYKDGLLMMSEHFKTQHYVRAVGAQ